MRVGTSKVTCAIVHVLSSSGHLLALVVVLTLLLHSRFAKEGTTSAPSLVSKGRMLLNSGESLRPLTSIRLGSIEIGQGAVGMDEIQPLQGNRNAVGLFSHSFQQSGV